MAAIKQLKSRDAEVRAHEAAHMIAGGRFTGGAQYTYQRGPDGVMYAVGGEVSINISSNSSDPHAVLEQAETIQRAALAPANPSSQDRRVAAKAAATASAARIEIAQTLQSEASGKTAKSNEPDANKKISAYLNPTADESTNSTLDLMA